jgi:hypothetical protein
MWEWPSYAKGTIGYLCRLWHMELHLRGARAGTLELPSLYYQDNAVAKGSTKGSRDVGEVCH